MSQPFADLIVSGRKRIELRSWNTKFRGEFLIHAPLKVRKEDAARLGITGKFVTGAVIGSAEIFDVKKYDTKAELMKDYELHLASKSFYRSDFGFMLRNARMFDAPFPCKGMLGFFKVRLPSKEFSDDSLVTEIIDEEYRHQWIGRH